MSASASRTGSREGQGQAPAALVHRIPPCLKKAFGFFVSGLALRRNVSCKPSLCCGSPAAGRGGCLPLLQVLPSLHPCLGGRAAQTSYLLPVYVTSLPSNEREPTVCPALCWVRGGYKRHTKWPLPSLSLGYSWKGQATQRTKSRLELSQQYVLDCAPQSDRGKRSGEPYNGGI